MNDIENEQVRDPMTRIVSSYHQATNDKSLFKTELEGIGRTPYNVHYRSQSMQLLSGQTKSGKRMKLHFIGKLEDFVRECQYIFNI
jgi:hypothetical protein